MTGEGGATLLLPVADWIRLIAATGMIAFVWLFTRETGRLLQTAFPATPDFAHMMSYLGLFVAVAMGYKTYMPLVGAVLPEALPGYRVVGAIGAIAPFLALVVTFFRRLNLVALAASQAIRRLFTVYPTVKCAGCGQVMPADYRFCPACGAELATRKEM
jgi:hypothetical protein